MFDTARSPVPNSSAPLRVLFALVAIILLGTFLRVYELDVTPPGLHYDEAFNALQARDVVRGVNRPIFFTGNFGEEPLQMYVAAVLFALVGESPWAIRLSSAVLGILLLPAIYFCARAFFPRQWRLALGATFVGAMLYWAINFSRIGIETNSLPVMLTLSAGALAKVTRTRSWKWGAGAGFLLGATLYTYLASRLWPVAVLLWLLYLVLLHRRFFHERFRQWVVVGVFALLTIAPLALFFLTNPLALTGRAGQVLTPERFGSNLVTTLGMFFFRGDTDPRDNLPGRAALDPFLAVLFSVGIIITATRLKKPNYAFLLIWLLVMTLPSALTEFAPNFRRAIGAMPAVALLCGIGLNEVWKWNLWLKFRYGRAVTIGVLALGLAFSAWSSAHAYFYEWASGPGLYYSFDAGLLDLACALKARPPDEHLYISPEYREHPTVLWAMDGRKFSSFDGRRVLVLPNLNWNASYGIITHEERHSAERLHHALSGTRLIHTLADRNAQPYAEVLYVPAGGLSQIQPQHPLHVRIGEFATLEGFDLSSTMPQARPGDHLELTLHWSSRAPVSNDFTVFAHLLGPIETMPSNVAAQSDSQPGGGTYPTSRWSPGETILDHYLLRIPLDARRGNYQIEVGMYSLATGVRVPVFDSNGEHREGDRILLSSLTIP